MSDIYEIAKEKLKDFYLNSLSPETRYQRFGTYAADIDGYVDSCIGGNAWSYGTHVVLPSINGDIVGHAHVSFSPIGVDKHSSMDSLVAEIGIAVADKYVGNGVGTALARTALNAAISNPRVVRVVMLYSSDNPAIYKIIKKLGFRSTVESMQSTALMQLDDTFGGEVSRTIFCGARAFLALAEYLRAVYVSSEYSGIELILGGSK